MITDLDTFMLAAIIKGYLPANDEDEYYSHLQFRFRAYHALGGDEMREHGAGGLDIIGEDPDDEKIHELAAKWSNELNGARTISFGVRGRRPKKELEWLRYRLYLLVEDEQIATVRGIYYRAVSHGYVPKDDAGYRLVQGQLLSMRRSGLLPWYWITDSSRRVWGRRRFKTMSEYAEWVQSNYRADYWMNSPVNVEVWCEKDALQGVLSPVVIDEFGLDLHVSKGQTSASYIYEAAEAIRDDGRPTTIYILSDFDPGGFRIAEKVESGLREHLGEGYELTANRIAVTFEQITEYGLPTRGVKKTDKQAPAFMEKYGDISCELDAIAPSRLRALVREHLEGHMDQRRLRALKLAEEREREGLKQIEDLMKGVA